MRLLEMDLLYSGRPWQDWRWKLSLASKSETQVPLSPPALYSGVYSYVPSSGD